MGLIEKTPQFHKWLTRFKDLKAKAMILFRIQKIETDGHFGDCQVSRSSLNALLHMHSRWS